MPEEPQHRPRRDERQSRPDEPPSRLGRCDARPPALATEDRLPLEGGAKLAETPLLGGPQRLRQPPERRGGLLAPRREIPHTLDLLSQLVGPRPRSGRPDGEIAAADRPVPGLDEIRESASGFLERPAPGRYPPREGLAPAGGLARFGERRARRGELLGESLDGPPVLLFRRMLDAPHEILAFPFDGLRHAGGGRAAARAREYLLELLSDV